MSCKKDCGFPIKPAPFAPADPGPCGPGPCGPNHPPMPPRPPVPCGPCPPSQYVGSRYVPIFADPIEWDIHRSYESLTIVTHDGESYTSKCNVGPGIDITNERYWAKTGAYNAQVEQYKNAVKDLSSQVSGFASDNAEFREKIDQFTKDNAEMKNTVAEDKARVDALAERVATAETEIDGLQATTAQHTTEIADLHAKDEDLQRQITSNDNDIAAIQAKDTEQDSRLNGIDTKLKSHDASIAQNTADIAKNTKNIQDNAANIAKNAHELADHAAKLADHEGRLTAQHEEITANHQAIERLTSVTDGLRSDLTEDEAKIEANRDAIAHIQEKDVQQDGRLDKLEECCEQAKAHFTQLDTKTDNTNTALTAEIDRAKAAELANGKLIAKNAHELADHAAKLADHEGRLTAQHEEITANHQAIERLTSVTDGLRSDLTEDEAKIEANRDAIAHIQEKDVQQDGRLDKLEECCEQAKAHFTQLDTKTDNTNTALTAEIDRAKAAELANGKLIAKNAAELAAQDTRITNLENDKADKTALGDYVTKTDFNADQKRQDDIVGDWETDHPGQTVSQCVTSQETTLAEHAASITNLENDKADKTALGDYVTKTDFNADQKRQDDIVGDWETDHPGQTVSQCVTSQETTLAEHAASIAKLEADKGTVDGLFPTSVEFPNVEMIIPHRGVSAVTESYTVFGFVYLPFLHKGTSSTANITVNMVAEARVFYFDGTTEQIPNEDVIIHGEFGPGYVCLRADIPSTSIPLIAVDKPLLLRLNFSVTVRPTAS